jgi:hypothetical protein
VRSGEQEGYSPTLVWYKDKRCLLHCCRFCLFVCLFIDYWTTFFSNSDYITSNERVISKWWIEKDVEGSGRGLMKVPVFTVLPNLRKQIAFICLLSILRTSQLNLFWSPLYIYRSRVSSGTIVSDYGLDDRAIGVRSPAGAKAFSSSLCVQTGSEAHPASCTMGTGGPFAGGKARLGRDADYSPPSDAEFVNE